MKTKKCFCCKQEKPIIDFWKHKGRKDGLASVCKTCNAQKNRKWFLKQNDDTYRQKRRIYHQNHKEVRNKYARQWNRDLKIEVFNEYGAICECCGENHLEILTIDHIHGLQGQKRSLLGSKLYSWLKQNGYPKDNFRTLCMNCNFAYGKYGYCPHTEEG